MNPVRSRRLLNRKTKSNHKIKDILTTFMNSRKVGSRPTSNGIMWKFKIVRRPTYRKVRSRATSVTKHYTDHKEAARALIHARLEHFNTHYNLTYKRVAIRNQRRSWGSCTSLGNLNFSYKILFLPPELSDYIVAHELCHLKELNHSERFWNLVAEVIPDYLERKTALRKYDHLHPFKLALLARERVN